MLLLFCSHVFASDDVIPIKNSEPGQYSLTRQEATWMFTMKTRFWNDGTRITVFYLDPTSRIHRKFCSEILGIHPDKFDQLVAAHINSGNASYFKLAQNKAEVYYKVGLLPGAIGYVDSDTIIIHGRGYVSELKVR